MATKEIMALFSRFYRRFHRLLLPGTAHGSCGWL